MLFLKACRACFDSVPLQALHFVQKEKVLEQAIGIPRRLQGVLSLGSIV